MYDTANQTSKYIKWIILKVKFVTFQILRKTKKAKESELKILDHENAEKLQKIEGLRKKLSPAKVTEVASKLNEV